MQVDDTVGSIMSALEKNDLTKNTLIIVTSDNGATPGADFKTLISKGHHPSYHLRGHKADIFEGGHRVPFVARWPAVIEPESKSEHTICLTDLAATAAEITGHELPYNAAEDSISFLPIMQQEPSNLLREATVHHSINGSFAIRQGKWKLILCPGSGGWSSPRPPQARKKKLAESQLYDLSKDIGEKNNVVKEQSEVAERLMKLLQSYVNNGRSTQGESQKNDTVVRIVK